MEPLFLNVADAIAIHRDQIKQYGGSLGIRDAGLLESALAMPATSFGDEFLHRDLFERCVWIWLVRRFAVFRNAIANGHVLRLHL
jgi:prophage maintenance system killer protein